MGKRGPARTPTNILKMRGSWLAATRINEPRPGNGPPVCPRWMTPDARKVWRKLIPQLVAIGVATMVDDKALVRYCEAWVRWKRAAEFLAKNGEAYPILNEDKKIKCMIQWPQVSIFNNLATLLLRLEQEFGLTPASRSNITIQSGANNVGDKSRFFRATAAG